MQDSDSRIGANGIGQLLRRRRHFPKEADLLRQISRVRFQILHDSVFAILMEDKLRFTARKLRIQVLDIFVHKRQKLIKAGNEDRVTDAADESAAISAGSRRLQFDGILL